MLKKLISKAASVAPSNPVAKAVTNIASVHRGAFAILDGFTIEFKGAAKVRSADNIIEIPFVVINTTGRTQSLVRAHFLEVTRYEDGSPNPATGASTLMVGTASGNTQNIAVGTHNGAYILRLSPMTNNKTPMARGRRISTQLTIRVARPQNRENPREEVLLYSSVHIA